MGTGTRLLRSFCVLALALLGAGLLGVHSGVAQVPNSSVPDLGTETVQIPSYESLVSPKVRVRARRAFRGADLKGKDGPMAPVGLDLATLFYQHRLEGARGVKKLTDAEGSFRQTSRMRSYSPLSADGRYVTIDAIASGSSARLRAELRRLGLRNHATTGHVVSGQLPIDALREAAQLSSLQGAFPSYARTHVGSVGSEADTAHRAYQGRADLGVDGTGQKVCALSDSYDNPDSSTNPMQDAEEDVQDGDLPGAGNPEGRTTPVDVLDDTEVGGDEGRAMLQLIHDIAPGSELGYHTAFGGIANFVNGIRDLADPNQGNCTILVDDVGYFAEPFYQDGPITNVADSVANEGIPYFSSAGNDGQNSYEAPYRGSGNDGVSGPGAETHDFDPSAAVDTLQEVKIEAGGTFEVFSFQWTDPSALVDGSVGADTDMDIFLLDDTLGVVAASTQNSDLDGNGVPWESIEYSNNGSVDTDHDGVADSTFHFVIEKYSGPDPDQVKYVYDGSGFEIKEYDTLGPTIYGHPMGEDVMAVAAAPFYNTIEYNRNADPAVLESFSSKGGIKIRFDQAGAPRASPEEREKPDVTGSDGTDNTFFGSDLSDTFFGGIDSDPHPNFFGTSAAAPNVAAIAALVREANAGFGTQEVYDQLISNAEDVTRRANRNDNFEFIDSGPDPWSGHGYVWADAAALPVELTDFQAVAEGSTVVLSWSTSSETNNAGFAVEHRRAGASFRQLGFVDGAGTTSTPQSYEYRTDGLTAGTHTFRLRQQDVDGSSTLSREVTVDIALSGAYDVSSVAPNPVRRSSTVSVSVRSSQTVRVSVYDMLGRRMAVVHDGRIEANAPTTLHVGSDLASGVYMLRIQGESFSATRKFTRLE